MNLRTLSLTVAILGVSAISGTTSAQYIKRTAMPDYDQKRTTLPNDGKQYCVPTSSVDLLRYMAWYGMPAQDLTYGTSYSNVTALIALVSILMLTDPYGGTSSAYSWPALRDWVWSNCGGKLVYQYYYGRDWSWSMNTVKNWQMAGAIARMGYGRYTSTSSGWRRDNGHSIAMAGVDFNGATKKFFVADPASDDGNWTSQGSFTIDTKDTGHITYTDQDYGQLTHARYTYWTGDSGNRRAIVDSMHVIQPVYGGWPFAGRSNTITTIMPWQWTTTEVQVPSEYTMSTSAIIHDWVYDVGDFGIWWLGHTGKVWYHDLLSNTTTGFTAVSNAKLIGVGGTTADVFVIIDNGATDRIMKINRETAKSSVITLPGKVTTFDYDDTSRRIAMLSPDGSTVISISEKMTDVQVDKLSRLTTAMPFASVPTLFKVDQSTGDYLVATRGGSTIERFRKVGGKRIGEIQSYRIANGIQSFTPFEGGIVVIQDGSTLYSFDKDFLPTPTQFSGISVEGDFKMSRSQALAKVEEMTGPGWADELPARDEP
ncbi:MAG: hypothetical protein HONBIEJF_00725 [Fimbriimonadaceae bacterium]|nr:hypothetical protein [Fimbriimonadaceae bacterium]